MTASSWLSQQFEVEMPLMAPGEKLCEVEFLKWLAAYQWRAIAASLGTQPRDIVNWVASATSARNSGRERCPCAATSPSATRSCAKPT